MSTVWIDALEFECYGGWTSETQFAHEMGQGYLMAIERPGEPVADAQTNFRVETEGMHRFWVRTKNWRPEASPGRFRLLVDGERLPRELGALPTSAWYWDTAGDVYLTAGEHEVCVQDTTGWFGRFADVVITDDMDYTPSPEKERLRLERARLRGEDPAPIFAGAFDVLVAGGGPGGLPAAIAAARKGMRVALVNARPTLGGNASDEAGVGFDGAGAAHAGMRETGIADELRRVKDFYHLTWGGALNRLAQAEERLSIFVNEFIIDAETEDGVIRRVTSLNVLTSHRTVYEAKVFIDATGDGWLGYYAGAKYRLGREPKWMYQEPFAPDQPDGFTMSGCIMGRLDGKQMLCYYAEDAGHPVPFTAPDWAIKLPEGDDLHRAPGRLHCGEWWVENPTDMDDLWEQEAIRDELIRLSLGYFHWVKNSYAKRDLAANLRLVAFPRYNAKRENRRIIGDYVLTQNDVCKETVFPDAIAYCGWPLDVHHPRGLYSGAEGPYYSNAEVPITAVPFRCLYSKNIQNLLLAGRCASVSHLALGTVRVESTLATLGQAAGVAAALCVRRACTPRDIYARHLDELQQTLLRDDQSIPWIRNQDPADLARGAKISATSVSDSEVYSPELGIETDWEALDTDRETLIWARQKTEGNPVAPDFFKVKLKNAGDAPVEVACEYLDARAGVDGALVLERAQIRLPAGFEGWAELPFTPRPEVFPWGVRLSACPEVFWMKLDYTSFRRARAYRLNRYHWIGDGSNAYTLKYSAQTLPKANCAPENALNGVNRALSADEYCWVSDPNQSLPQALTLTWAEPKTLSRVLLTLDTDSKHPAYSYLALPIAVQTARDISLEACVDGAWRELGRVTDNILRHLEIDFDPVRADALRVIIQRTWGDPSARIFEVRAYESH